MNDPWKARRDAGEPAPSVRPWPQRTAPPPVKPRKPREPKLPEWMLQAAFVAQLHALEASGMPITCAGDMNAGRRSYAQAARDKASGMTPGEPDVRIYLPDGKALFVEIKREDGVVSEAQDLRHVRLAALGHTVVVLWLKDLQHARQAARKLVSSALEGQS